MKHFQEKRAEAQRAAKASEMHQKRITGFIAKMIKTFWSNAEKVCIAYFKEIETIAENFILSGSENTYFHSSSMNSCKLYKNWNLQSKT